MSSKENAAIHQLFERLECRYALRVLWALRVVRANLAISVVPREVAAPFAQTAPVRIVPLSDAWAQRRFAICYRDEQALSPAAQLLVKHLASASAGENPP